MSKAQEKFIVKNLAKPQGHLGKKVGEYMAAENHELNTWAVQLLDVQATDHILEVGFGPGLAIRDLASRVTNGRIVGLDYSELMVLQAKKLNKQAIQQGQVELHLGNVSNLPSFEAPFDKILAVNNVMYWENQLETLKGLKNSLKPGGWISIVLQRSDEMYRSGKCSPEIEHYKHLLREAGFSNVEVAINPLTLKRPKKKTQVIAGISIRGFNGLVLPAITNELDLAMLFQSNNHLLFETQAKSIYVRQRIS